MSTKMPRAVWLRRWCLTGSLLPKPRPATRLVVLNGLLAVLKTWVPVIFWVGYSVQQCSWEDRPGGALKGDHAMRVLKRVYCAVNSLLDEWDLTFLCPIHLSESLLQI